MQPRLPSSRQWTPLPKEFISQVESVFSESFKEHRAQGAFEAMGRIYPGEILVRVGYLPKGQLKHSHFEVSIGYRQAKDNVMKLLHLAVDAAGALFDQYFSAESDEDFPVQWEEMDFEGQTIFVQYTTVNTKLEAEADRILGVESGDNLAGGDWDEATTPEAIKATLGIDPEDDDNNDDDGSDRGN